MGLGGTAAVPGLKTRAPGCPALALHHPLEEALWCGGYRSGSQHVTVPLTQPTEKGGSAPDVLPRGSLQICGHFPLAPGAGEVLDLGPALAQ